MKQQGISLIELLCCMGLFAIVLGLALPAFGLIKSSAGVQRTLSQLQQAVYTARLKAYTEHQEYRLIPLSQDWSIGAQLMHQHHMIHAWRWEAPGLQVQWHGMESSQQVIFAADPAHALCNGFFLITAARLQKKLVLNRLGRARVA